MVTLNAINYQISQLKKQIVKLEIKRANISKTAPMGKEKINDKFFICDDQENFCLGNIYELEKHICNCECPVYWT